MFYPILSCGTAVSEMEVEVVTEAGDADTVLAIAEQHNASDFRLDVEGEDGKQITRLLVADDKLQSALDALQTLQVLFPVHSVRFSDSVMLHLCVAVFDKNGAIACTLRLDVKHHRIARRVALSASMALLHFL